MENPLIICYGTTAQLGPRPPPCEVSRSHTHTHPVGILWTSDQLAANAATYKIHNKHKRLTSMSLVGFEPAIPAVIRLQTYALDCTATGIGPIIVAHIIMTITAKRMK
jgi:hypothetical protein